MIFHIGQIDKGITVGGLQKWGCNLIASPMRIPPPANEVALKKHLDSGAILVFALSKDALPKDFTKPVIDNVLPHLELMKEQTSEPNQRMLLLIGDKGKSYRQSQYRDLAREWVKAGGVYHYLDSDEDLCDSLDSWAGVELREFNLVSFLASLPGVSIRRAKVLADTYGPGALHLLTYVVPESIANLKGMEGMSLGDLRKIRERLQLEHGVEINTIELTEEDIREREFYTLAEELGGKVVERA